MLTQIFRPRQFTGKHMIAVMVLFFGTIISVNLTLAFYATSSWSGLIVKNSYVASQQFNDKVAEARRQAALGWSARFSYADGRYRLELANRAGLTVADIGATLHFRRPTTEREDRVVKAVSDGDGLIAGALALPTGQWVLELTADVSDDLTFRKTQRFTVTGSSRRGG